MKTRSMFQAAAVASAFGLSLAAAPVAAQQAMKLRVADVYPVKHPVPNSTVRVFMEAVEKRSKGAVTFEYFPSEQLGKGRDLLSLTQSGVVDIGLVVPSYVSDKMPLAAVTELPGSYSSSCQGTLAAWELLQEGQALARHEFDPNGVQTLIVHAFAPFQAWSSKGVKSSADFSGQKLRSLGAVMDITITKLGATPVRISAPEIYQSLSRGTIDGGMLGAPTVLSYDLVKHIKQGTQGMNFGGALVTYTMSKTKWNALSPELRKIMLEAGKEATLSGCKAADDQIGTSLEKAKAGGIEIVTYPDAEKAKINGILAQVADEWAAQLDKRSRPGTEIVQAFRKAVANVK